MNRYLKSRKIFLISYLLLIFCGLDAQRGSPYTYINPKPGSIGLSVETNIILRHASSISQAAWNRELIKVEGSLSGVHEGEFILAEDNRTMIFNPERPFAPNEQVSVTINEGLKTLTGTAIHEFSFYFRTDKEQILRIPEEAFADLPIHTVEQDISVLKGTAATASLPPPNIQIDSIDNPSEGYIFLATWDRNIPAQYGNFIFILDRNGAIVDSVRVNGAPYDFQVQPNGLLSYALGDFSSNVPLPGEELQHMVLDEDLALVDSFKMKNGYITDFHEFKMLPNGHVMMMSYHTIIYDMSTIVEGGKPDASLVINVIQEQDRNKNVVFEWRNIDYIPITDSDLDLTDSRINYSTLNAFDLDHDGNILASFRNHSEIMKISRETGEVMWRMGGPRGEFSYIGEHEENAPYYHARQHNIQRQADGHITLFDNGEFHQPPYSRAVEYELDELNKEVTLVSEWRYPQGNIFCVTAGNAQRLPNGGWFIGYGVPNPQFVFRNVVEVHPDGSKALELSLPRGILAYRASKFPWKETVSKPGYTHYEVREGNSYSFNDETIVTGVEISYNALTAADYNEATITRVPYGPIDPEFTEELISVSPVSITYEVLAISAQSAAFHIDLEVYPEIRDPKHTIVYQRDFPGQGLFTPVSTTWDSLNNELIATVGSYGEIVFGVPAAEAGSEIPILYAPADGQKLLLQDSIAVKWTGKGLYSSFNVQVAADSNFTSILTELNTRLSEFYLKGIQDNMTYFWRVNAVLGGETGEWSKVWSFEITDPYIQAVAPNGGETWYNGNTEIIRWETNLLERVRIDLMQDETLVLALDTVPGSQQAYAWELGTELQAGDNYSIRISSDADPSVFGTSAGAFSIADTTTGLGDLEAIPGQGYQLAQNFPNPFHGSTRIEYMLAEAEFISLKVYNLTGQEVQTLVSEYQHAGSYSCLFNAADLPGGIYFYEMRVGDKYLLTRKMLLAR